MYQSLPSLARTERVWRGEAGAAAFCQVTLAPREKRGRDMASKYHNLSNEALADEIGRVDAIAKAAEAELKALKDEFPIYTRRADVASDRTVCKSQIGLSRAGLTVVEIA
jgi:hypothetical protein